MAYTIAQIKQSRAEARKLTSQMSAGWSPPAISVPIRLQPGENCYAQGPAQVWQYLEGDGTYVHKSRGGFGMLGLAVVAGTAIGNKARATRAARESAAQFRPIDQGALYLTDRRFAVQGQRQWIDLWFENIRMSSCDGSGITFHVADVPPVQLHVWPIDYYFAMFHFLAYKDIIQIPADPS